MESIANKTPIVIIAKDAYPNTNPIVPARKLLGECRLDPITKFKNTYKTIKNDQKEVKKVKKSLQRRADYVLETAPTT